MEAVPAPSFPLMLTFDLDAESGVLARDPANAQRPGVLSRGRYGPRVALFRILDLLGREGIPATFFIPGWVIDHHPKAAAAVRDAGHEISHHGYHHTPPGTLDLASERTELEQGIQAIETLTGQRPVGYRSPSWDFSPQTLALLREHGFLYSSNFMDDDGPYLHPPSAGAPPLVELPVQWLLDDWPFFGYRPPDLFGLTPPSAVYEIWTEELAGLHAETGKCLVLTMHPQVIGRPSRLRMLERFITFARSLPQLEFRSCRDVARAMLAASPVGAPL